ncbi:hypothetical protein RM530_07000 [Algiphilus sp. W345]|uniref:Uncharacterized protein n=1 Tax=Banduia mediterranea TaxID=3075609 RepID=A0ABU2WJ45_9GAMM|nr:hypothetical protein [Algiphilus sp. W345]MDT0497112.1 hypothetical protein [Algiphilus sp. W345]
MTLWVPWLTEPAIIETHLGGRALVEALLMLLKLLMAVFLEKHTAKTSTNSSRP